MQQKFIQIAGIIWTLVYASIIVWIYATEPRSFKEVATNSQLAAGIYEINQEKFNNGLTLFRRDQFRAARDEWAGADPAGVRAYADAVEHTDTDDRTVEHADPFAHGAAIANKDADTRPAELGSRPGHFVFHPQALPRTATRRNPFAGTMLDDPEDLKDFEIRVSSSGTDEGSFLGIHGAQTASDEGLLSQVAERGPQGYWYRVKLPNGIFAWLPGDEVEPEPVLESDAEEAA